MDILVLNTSLSVIGVIDTYESLIWNQRYQEYGDFELFIRGNLSLLSLLDYDNYLWIKKSDKLMIIEGVKINSDFDNGLQLTITGRSLESILDRRIIWAKTVLTGSMQDGIKKILDDSIIAPTDTTRKINNFEFLASTDPVITALTFDGQFTGENVYETISNLCAIKNIGFKIYLSAANKFVFTLYSGVDRSYAQSVNPYVVFSPKYGNLINSEYIESRSNLKTVSLVGGEGTGDTRKYATATIDSGAGNGLSRREMFTDAAYISKVANGVTQSDTVYTTQLQTKGKEELGSMTSETIFDSQVESLNTFVLGVDYFLGDIVQVANEYGIESSSRITEIIISNSISGLSIYPNFKKI